MSGVNFFLFGPAVDFIIPLATVTYGVVRWMNGTVEHSSVLGAHVGGYTFCGSFVLRVESSWLHFDVPEKPVTH